MDVDKEETFNVFFTSFINIDNGTWDPWSPVLEDHDWRNNKLPAGSELL